MNRKVFLVFVLCMALVLGGGMSLRALIFVPPELKQNQYTVIQGIAPSSDVYLESAFFIKKAEEDQQRVSAAPTNKHPYDIQYANHVFKADKNGEVRLPPLAQSHDFYKLRFRSPGADSDWVELEINIDHESAKFDVTGSGLKAFSPVSLEKDSGRDNLKTDWAGQFKIQRSLAASDYTKGDHIKIALLGNALDPAILQEQPSSVIQVVIGQGGGPTNSQVNQYSPPIGNCGAPLDSSPGASVFQPSTCDTDRVESHLDPELSGIQQNYVRALMLSAEQLSAVMMYQMNIVGMFFDAKIQQETQRHLRHLVVQAHKDYHPSELMCEFGSFVKSVHHSQSRATTNTLSLNKILLDYYTQQYGQSSFEGSAASIDARFVQFKQRYCNPNDSGTALWQMCRGQVVTTSAIPITSSDANVRNRYNRDINMHLVVEKPLTLNVNFTDNIKTDTEEEIIALAKYLYWPKVYKDVYNSDRVPNALDNTRGIIAKYVVAHNSFTNIVGMKSNSSPELGNRSGPAYMKSMIREFGISDTDIGDMLGSNPSYYAQMEVLTKLMYQNPNFYTNLYDKPVNVDRINATLEAIQLMQNRDRFESLLRQESLISILVEQGLVKPTVAVNGKIGDITIQSFPKDPSGF